MKRNYDKQLFCKSNIPDRNRSKPAEFIMKTYVQTVLLLREANNNINNININRNCDQGDWRDERLLKQERAESESTAKQTTSGKNSATYMYKAMYMYRYVYDCILY